MLMGHIKLVVHLQKIDISGSSQISNPVQIELIQVVLVHNPLLIIETNPIITVLTKLALTHLKMDTYKCNAKEISHQYW